MKSLAPQVGLEPTTLRLTAECSTIELLRSKAGEMLSRQLQQTPCGAVNPRRDEKTAWLGPGGSLLPSGWVTGLIPE